MLRRAGIAAVPTAGLASSSAGASRHQQSPEVVNQSGARVRVNSDDVRYVRIQKRRIIGRRYRVVVGLRDPDDVTAVHARADFTIGEDRDSSGATNDEVAFNFFSKLWNPLRELRISTQ